jgi:hypothetical protein
MKHTEVLVPILAFGLRLTHSTVTISDTWLYTLRYFEVYTNKEYIIVS